MKKLFPFFLLFIFHLSLCSAQDVDTIVYRNGKKITGKVIIVGKDKIAYITPPDSTQTEISTWRLDYIIYPGGIRFAFTGKEKPPAATASSIYLCADGGLSVPSVSYRDGIAGFHFGPKLTYYLTHTLGIVAKAQVDFNGTGLDYISSNYWGGLYIFQQYLAGITYRTGGKPGFPFVDFVGLVGLCKAASPESETGGGVNPLLVSTPRSGSGAGYYFGIDFTSSSSHFVSFTFGAGFLYAAFTYPDFTNTLSTYYPYTGITRYTTSDPVAKTSLVLYQMYVGINFRLKKAGK
jgi:hypothetical protein